MEIERKYDLISIDIPTDRPAGIIKAFAAVKWIISVVVVRQAVLALIAVHYTVIINKRYANDLVAFKRLVNEGFEDRLHYVSARAFASVMARA